MSDMFNIKLPCYSLNIKIQVKTLILYYSKSSFPRPIRPDVNTRDRMCEVSFFSRASSVSASFHSAQTPSPAMALYTCRLLSVRKTRFCRERGRLWWASAWETFDLLFWFIQKSPIQTLEGAKVTKQEIEACKRFENLGH